MRKLIFSICLLLSLQLSAYSQIDLVTVPERRAVQLTIYNSADLTLVRDSRLLTFKKGNNVLQFTWSNTLIDPSSIELKFRSHSKDLQLQDTVYPPQRSEALQWNVDSKFDGEAEIEITYFTSGISWHSSYKAHLTDGDSKMNLRGDVAISNHSGEDYPNAKVRLVVGTIHLVEEISKLARERGGWKETDKDVKNEAYDEMTEADGAFADDKFLEEQKNIVKEGLSEYFIFSIEGNETIPNGWTKSLNSVDVKDIPVEVTFRLQNNWNKKLQRFLRFDNRDINKKKDKTNLGQSPLPNGDIQLYRRQPNQDLSFLARLNMPYIAINEKSELNTGAQDEVTIKRVLYKYSRDNVKFSTDRWNNVKLKSYDEILEYKTVLTNTMPHKALIEIQRRFAQKASVSTMKYKQERIDDQTFKYYPELSKNRTDTFNYTVTINYNFENK